MRSSVIHREQESNASRETDTANVIARCFSAQIRSVLQGPILPDNFGDTFDPSEAPLYVAVRKISGISISKRSKFPFEAEFYKILNDPEHSLLCPVAREGVGKSTFLRFFFDSYLPNVKKPYVTIDAPEVSNITNPLVLYSNLQIALTEKSLKQKLFHDFRQQIREKYPDIAVRDNFSMWTRRVDWDDPIHEAAARSYTDSESYRAGYVNSLTRDDEVWVNEAIWYLSSAPEMLGSSIIAVFDNVDQLDENLQLHVINICREWIENLGMPSHPTSKGVSRNIPLKVVIPLRPETQLSLERIVQPLPYRAIMPLGPVDENALILSRKNMLLEIIKKSDCFVERDTYTPETGTIVFNPLIPDEAAEILGNMLTYDVEPVLGNTNTIRLPLARRIIDSICDDSMRRSLIARWRIINSIEILRNVEFLQRKESHSLGNYAMLDAFLVAGRDYFDELDPLNLVVNLFNICPNSEPPYCTTIGVHMLHLMRTEAPNFDQLVSLLTSVGYRRSEIEQCLNVFLQAQLVTRSENLAGQKKYSVNHGICEGYFLLLNNPAYLDNMAIITPVDDKHLTKMLHTVSYREDDFTKRVQTTLQFLEQIEEDENLFCKYSGVTDRCACIYKDFETAINRLRLPSAFRLGALGYRQRLEGLKSDRPGFTSRISDNDWKRLMEDPSLLVNDSRAKFPLVALEGK